MNARRAIAPSTVLALLSFTVGACGETDVQQKPLLTVRTPEDVVACGGELAAQEAFIRQVFAFFDEPVPEDLALTLHVADEETVNSECSNDRLVAGCAFGTTAWSAGRGADRHELVHLVMNELAGSTISVLSEGIAEVVGRGNQSSSSFSHELLPLSSLVTTDHSNFDIPHRAAAALFVHYFLRRFSAQRFLELYTELPRDSDGESVDRAFRDVLGLSVAEVDADWRRAEKCMRQFVECVEGGLPPLETPFVLRDTIDCSSDSTLGYRDSGQPATTSREPYVVYPVRVLTSGDYIAEFSGGFADISRCASICAGEQVGDFGLFGSWPGSKPGDVHRIQLQLEEGSYRLMIRGAEESGAFRFSLRPVDE